jgi:hypothetical protein
MAYLTELEDEKTGLLDVGVGHWSQTSVVDWATVHSRNGQSTVLNALYYQTLLNATEIAKVLNQPEQANLWQQRATLLQQQITQNLYMPSYKRYASTILNGDLIMGENPHVDWSVHAQAWALANDVVPQENREDVIDSLITLLEMRMDSDFVNPGVEIYGVFWLLEALGKNERITEANAIIRKYYGRLIDLGATSWWEHFYANTNYKAALSHGWGSSPSWFLSTYALGLRQINANQCSASPNITFSRNASGAIPVTEGQLSIDWSYQPCATSTISITAPQHMQGQITSPIFTNSVDITLTSATETITDTLQPNEQRKFTVYGGLHTLTINELCFDGLSNE